MSHTVEQEHIYVFFSDILYRAKICVLYGFQIHIYICFEDVTYNRTITYLYIF